MNEKFNNELVNSFILMQNTYVFDDKYKISIDKVVEIVNNLKDIFINLE